MGIESEVQVFERIDLTGIHGANVRSQGSYEMCDRHCGSHRTDNNHLKILPWMLSSADVVSIADEVSTHQDDCLHQYNRERDLANAFSVGVLQCIYHLGRVQDRFDGQSTWLLQNASSKAR